MEPSSGIHPGVKEGDILAGKYRVERVLGIGGMGVVVAAYHLQLDERVALKFLHPQAVANPDAAARFDREARAAVKIKSEHVARVSDVGRLENGAPYMVMEYLEGTDLSAWLQQKGSLEVEQAVDFVLQACEALAEAHALGIVHRDLKPANLFCIRRADGLLAIKVLDFGISKVGGAGSDASITRTNAVMGSPLYMSPEQVQSSKSVDARSDVWSLGTILFELVTGRPPFEADSIGQLVHKIMFMPPANMREARADVSIGFERVVLHCLEKDPARRYANVAELALALADFGPKRARASIERTVRVIESAGLSARTLDLPASVTPPEAPSATAASWGQTRGTAASGGKSWSVAAVATILFVALGVLAARTVVGRPGAVSTASLPVPSTSAAAPSTVETIASALPPSPPVASPPPPEATSKPVASAPKIRPTKVVAVTSSKPPALDPRPPSARPNTEPKTNVYDHL